MSWRFDHRSQARLAGVLQLEAEPRFPPSILLAVDGEPAFSVPTAADGDAWRFDAILGSWAPSYSREITLSAPGAEPMTLAVDALDAEPPLLSAHIDCATARTLIGWGVWAEGGAWPCTMTPVGQPGPALRPTTCTVQPASTKAAAVSAARPGPFSSAPPACTTTDRSCRGSPRSKNTWAEGP